jgi:predicted metal-dependent hydrolase
VKFSFPVEADRYFFFNQNPLASLVFVVFSGVFPPGERFFVESVRRFRDQVSDPVLQAQIAGFIGQEALHGREHDRLNAFFSARNLDVKTPDRGVKWGLRQLERFSPRLQLACTTMMEHFTAHLAEQWLTHEAFRNSSDGEMLKLWYWHALEELEHKTVAYDVFEQVGGTLAERRIALGLVLALLAPPIIASWGVLLLKEGQLLNVQENLRGLRALFGKNGFISGVLKHMPAYMKPGFHPSQQQTQALENEWRERLFGRYGELLDEYKNSEALASA